MFLFPFTSMIDPSTCWIPLSLCKDAATHQLSLRGVSMTASQQLTDTHMLSMRTMGLLILFFLFFSSASPDLTSMFSGRSLNVLEAFSEHLCVCIFLLVQTDKVHFYIQRSSGFMFSEHFQKVSVVVFFR